MKFKSLSATLLGATALGLASLAVAQPAPPPAEPHDRMDHQGREGREHKTMPDMAKRMSEALQLTPAQQPALTAYIDSMKPPADKGDGQPPRMDMGKMTTPQRMDDMRAKMVEALARFDARATATKKFYAQLTPSQQKVFDNMHAKMRHNMRGPDGGERRGQDRPHRMDKTPG